MTYKFWKKNHTKQKSTKPAELDFMPLKVASSQTINCNVFEMDEVLSQTWACH